jgi:L-threonate 2-dehydrogenase
MPTVVIVAQGEMGAGIARRLTENGARVLTVLDGRSETSRERARAAGMEDASWDALSEAAIFLSVLPPGEALVLAQRMAELWAGRGKTPIYVDCNAINPETVGKIGDLMTANGVAFIDAGIIGGPPRPGQDGPKIYASGPEAWRLIELRSFGLDVEILEAPIGAASALKMSYGGITKGLTAIGAVMVLAALRSGAGPALKRELAASQPALSAWLGRQCLGMIPKAYRWVAEMEEIAGFQGEDEAGAQIYDGIAQFYERLAEDEGAGRLETGQLRDFFTK